MDGSSKNNPDITELLQELDEITRKSVKPAGEVTNIVERIAIISNEGLSNHALDKLIDLITLPNGLDQSKKSTLIRNLYPNSRVSNSLAFRVVGSLGHGQSKPSYMTQSRLLKWLIMIYGIIEDQNVFSQAYSILFNLLDTASLRSQLCHLLVIITRRKHVKPFRIQRLMELMQKAGNEPALIGLMQTFKDYYPDFLISSRIYGRASVFKHPNPEWRERLHRIQINAQKFSDNQIAENENFCRVERIGEREYKHVTSILSEIQPPCAQEFSTTLKETQDIEKFITSLEKIETSSQLVAVIGDSFMQKFMQLRRLKHDTKRVEFWLLAFFDEQNQNSSENKAIMKMLCLVLEYTRFKKDLPISCLRYIKSVLPSWDGLQGRAIVLNLLEFIPFGSYTDLLESIFQPLEAAILEDDSVESKIALIKFYTALINRWIIYLLINPEKASIAEPPFTSLILHVNNLTLSTLQASKSVATASTVLKFYETTAVIGTHESIAAALHTILPHPETIYSLCSASSLSTLSRTCAILDVYKRTFDAMKKLKSITLRTSPNQQIHENQSAKNLNSHLIDLYNCLWQSQAFSDRDSNSKNWMLYPLVIQSYHEYLESLENPLQLNSLFSFSFSPTTCLLTFSYIAEMEDKALNLRRRHSGPLTRSSLEELQLDKGLTLTWNNYRLGVLRYLEDNGAIGISYLIRSTIDYLESGEVR